MLIKKVSIILVLIVLCLLYGCEYNGSANVIFYPSRTGNSAAQAVGMVAGFYDRLDLAGRDDLILPEILDNGSVNLTKMALYLSVYANCAASHREFSATDEGQNLALSLLAYYLNAGSPVILPLINNFYPVVIYMKGSNNFWGNRPVAEQIGYYDQNGSFIKLYANTIKQTVYRPTQNRYHIIVCTYSNNGYNEAEANYRWFKSQNGTYYGAPLNYRVGVGFTTL